jgi:hypothetical protein
MPGTALRASLYNSLKGHLNMDFIGELAALATSFFFAFTALIFTKTGRMVGSQVTNRMRLTFALIYLVILNPFSFDPYHSPLNPHAGYG